MATKPSLFQDNSQERGLVPNVQFMTEDELRALATYRYYSADRSIFTKLFLNKFWDLIVRFLIPTKMAPNLLTFFGLLCNICSLLLIIFASPDLHTSNVSGRVWVIVAILNSLYQHLDGCDGKQARKIGAASPLGQLFDHGVDGLCAGIHFVIVVALFEAGHTVIGRMVLLSGPIVFAMYTLEEYISHVLRLDYFSGPIEGTIVLQIILILSGVFGNNWAKTRVFTLPFSYPLGTSSSYVNELGKTVTDIQIRDFILLGVFAGSIIMAFGTISVALNSLKERKREEEEKEYAKAITLKKTQTPLEDTIQDVEQRAPISPDLEQFSWEKYRDDPISGRKVGEGRVSAPEGICPRPGESPIKAYLRIAFDVMFPYFIVLAQIILLIHILPQKYEIAAIVMGYIMWGGLTVRLIVARVASIDNMKEHLWPLHINHNTDKKSHKIKGLYLIFPILCALPPHEILFKVVFVVELATLVNFLCYLVKQIADFLDIGVFTVSKNHHQ